MIRTMLRPATREGDVYVITDARWPVGGRFTQDRDALFRAMRLDFEHRARHAAVSPYVMPDMRS